MTTLQYRVAELLLNHEIELFIGYEQGTRTPHPAFISDAKDVERLLFDDTCTGNLAVYLTHKDKVAGKRVGIAASYYALKSIAILYTENQLAEENLCVFVMNDNGELNEITTRGEIFEYLNITKMPVKEDEDTLLQQIENMKPSERWQFWSNELSKCFKCYACRSACPMCYCSKCIVEINRPQWIAPWASTQSNIDWQINRVMHLAGRCSDCGACGTACPMGIPIHILTHKMAGMVKENFGIPDGKGNVLSTFKPDDGENFIG